MDDPTTRSPLILIVDDDWLNRELLEGILAIEGLRSISANSGAKALQLVQEHAPDVIVLDVHMPGMSGEEVCTRLKASPRTADIGIIMISAADQSDDVERAHEAGADDFLSRTRLSEELVLRIRRLLK